MSLLGKEKTLSVQKRNKTKNFELPKLPVNNSPVRLLLKKLTLARKIRAMTREQDPWHQDSKTESKFSASELAQYDQSEVRQGLLPSVMSYSHIRIIKWNLIIWWKISFGSKLINLTLTLSTNDLLYSRNTNKRLISAEDPFTFVLTAGGAFGTTEEEERPANQRWRVEVRLKQDKCKQLHLLKERRCLDGHAITARGEKQS